MSDTVESYKISLDNQIERLEASLKEKPDDPSTLMAFGEMSLRRGRKLVALLAYQKVAEIKPDVLEVHLALVKIYGSQKMYVEAYSELVLALKLEKGSVEARVLYDILTHESPPPDDLAHVFMRYFSTTYQPEEINLYRQQLNIEKERLTTDVRELSLLLETSPMDTILEYNKNMAARRLSVIEELLDKTKDLESMKGEPAVVSEPEAPHSPVEVELVESPASEPKLEQAGEAGPPVEESATREVSAEILQSLREILDPVMQNFKKTKGIVAVATFHLKEGLVHAIQDDTINLQEMAQVLSEALVVFLSFSGDIAFWVVEFQKGVMVLQAIGPTLFLCAVGDSSTSFGSLRFHMDKNHSLFLEALNKIDLSVL